MSNPAFDVQPTVYDLLYDFFGLGTDGAADAVNAQIAAGHTFANSTVGASPSTAKTADFDLVEGEGPTFAVDKATTATVTVLDEADEPIPDGAVYKFVQLGAGEVAFVADDAATITVNAAFDPETSAAGAVAFLQKLSGDDWVLYGDLAASA